jgi:hypothetical protein
MASPDRPRLPDVRAALEAAVNARGTAYHCKKAFVFYFELDNTSAEDDVRTLSYCFEDVFDIQPTVVKLEATDRFPGCTLAKTVNSTLENMESYRNPLPSLLILAYVGHGTLDTTTGMLKLVAGPGRQNIQWSQVHSSFFSQNILTTNVDTLGILDCCYSGSTRETTERACQILSACGAAETTRSRSGGAASFSRRFYRAARNLKANDRPFATVEDLVVEINREKSSSSSPDAQLTYHGGARPIAIPFKGASSAYVQQALQNLSLVSPAATTQSVLVELSIAGSPAQILEEFKDVIASLPAQFRVEIVDAYESTSILFLLRMSQPAHLRLSSTLDFRFIGRIHGASLIRS